MSFNDNSDAKDYTDIKKNSIRFLYQVTIIILNVKYENWREFNTMHLLSLIINSLSFRFLLDEFMEINSYFENIQNKCLKTAERKCGPGCTKKYG